MPEASGPAAPPLWKYGAAVVVLVAGILVQYTSLEPSISVFWEAELVGSLITYGPGLLAFFALIGPRPLLNAARRTEKAVLEGLRWYGTLGVLSLLVALALGIILTALDPRFERLLDRTTGVEQAGMADPWLWIVLSFPIGLVEETLFRGFVLGGSLLVFGTRKWRWNAVGASLLFAGVHLYYGATYLEASVIDYSEIFFLGLAYSYVYYYSGGNLLMVAFLHGLYDATSFSQFLPGMNADSAAELQYGFLFFAAFVALLLYLREQSGPFWTSGSTGAPPPSSSNLPPGTAPFFAGASPMPAPGLAPPPSSGTAPSASPPPGVVGTSGSVAAPPSVAPSPSPVGFAPPLCPNCGAIVMGDIPGVPGVCPRCGALLATGPWGMPSTAVGATAGPPGAQLQMAVPRPAPPPAAFRPIAPVDHPQERGTTPWDGLPPGAWPPHFHPEEAKLLPTTSLEPHPPRSGGPSP